MLTNNLNKINMKKLKYLLILGLFFIALGCEDEELPAEVFDVTWVTNIRPTEDYIIKAGESISFRDLSQGALSHEFIIEEGNQYLIAGFGSRDSLPLWVDKNADLITNNKDAHVLFNNQGINRVTIRNTFKDSITYRGAEPIPAFMENGVWVVENTWEVDVFGPLKPAFRVLDKNDVEILNVSGDDFEDLVLDGNNGGFSTDEEAIEIIRTWPVINVEAGDELKFIDLTTEDRPNSRSWRLTRASLTSNTDSIASAAYFSLGTFSAGVLTSRREGDLPAETVTKLIPLVVNVIPSSQPFEYNVSGGITENSDETITIGLTGEVVPFTGEEGNFIVNVKNAATGFDQDIPVLLAQVNEDNATKIDLKLDGAIFNTDEITISYSGGAIESVDTRILNDFGPVPVTKFHIGQNLVEPNLAGFESFNTNWRKAYASQFWVGGSNGGVGNEFFARTIDKFANGVASMQYNSPSGITSEKKLQGTRFKDSGIEAGTYRVSISVYLEPGNTMNMFRTINTNPWTILDWDISTINRGEWITLSKDVTFDSNLTARYDIVVVPSANPDAQTGEQKMYFDDISFQALELRP